jgi:hypothetical protein
MKPRIQALGSFATGSAPPSALFLDTRYQAVLNEILRP